MKLVIGTRRWLGPEWTHVDIDSRPLVGEDGTFHAVDIVTDARRINLPDGAATTVYAQEVLEHFPWREWRGVLGEWCRLLAPGGEIIIEVPDFLAAFQQVIQADSLEMDEAIQQIIFGGQVNEYDYHYVGLTPRMLTDALEANGILVVDLKRGWEHGWLMVRGKRP